MFYREKIDVETLQNLEITVNTKLWELPLLENSFSFSNPEHVN
ncbi:hypothetical protein LEP1GSC081_4169 [Leptospira kirschneri str. H1]|uniref:Uncharacterized protein n=1 Tax=Leptospira kirschneri str. H1 TaxID=1049966 RepID=A0A0E2B409_9LEPT|nr:hypothetical protein LEP1GSC081_4169 [Leptospira kirschneri str. H1]